MRGVEDGTKSTDCWTLTITLYYFTGHKHLFQKVKEERTLLGLKCLFKEKRKQKKTLLKHLKSKGESTIIRALMNISELGTVKK